MKRDFEQLTWNESLEDACRKIVRLAVLEDLDREYDWTTISLVEERTRGQASLVMRGPGVIAGLQPILVAVDEMQVDVEITLQARDGDTVSAGTEVAFLEGSARDILTAERILLNLCGRLSGVATLAQQYVSRIEGLPARIYDTRKTIPGWRLLDKYAAHCGGVCNHRIGLYSAVMIKDNHLALSAESNLTPREAICKSRQFLEQYLPTTANSVMPNQLILEVEVDTIEQLKDVLSATPDIVLLDNMSLEELRRGVAIRDLMAPQVELEASGGISLDTVRAIAETGVDRISVGAITHSAVNLDVALDWK